MPHLRTAPYVTVSAGDSLEGVILFNHYTHPGPRPPRRAAAASQNGGPHRGDSGRLRGPILWEARDLSTWKASAEDASEIGKPA